VRLLARVGGLDRSINSSGAPRHRFPPANVELPASIANPPPAAGAASTTADEGKGQKKKHLLDSSDTLFADLRDRNFQVVRHRLSETARRLQSEITEVRPPCHYPS
jgi:hypothetical protein